MRFRNILLPLTALLLAATPATATELRIKFSHVVRPETPKGKASQYFKRLVEQRSGDRVQVEIFPEGRLANDHEVLQELRANRIQMAAPSLSKLTRFDPQLQLFDLPFLFQDDAHLRRVVAGEVGRSLLAGARREGLVALDFWDNGFKQLTANRPLLRPEDLAGLRMRIEGSNVQKAQFARLGAATRTLPFPELYEALARGTADGQENSLSNIYSQRLYEVQTNLTISNHAYSEYLILTSETFWEQVPEDLQVIIRGAIKDAGIYAREMASQINIDALSKIEATGAMRVHTLSPAEREVWRKKLQTIYPRFAQEIGVDLIRKAQTAEIR